MEVRLQLYWCLSVILVFSGCAKLDPVPPVDAFPDVGKYTPDDLVDETDLMVTSVADASTLMPLPLPLTSTPIPLMSTHPLCSSMPTLLSVVMASLTHLRKLVMTETSPTKTAVPMSAKLLAVAMGMSWRGLRLVTMAMMSTKTAVPMSVKLLAVAMGMSWRGLKQDDGNDVDEDGCTNECEVARCGDGYRHEGVEVVMTAMIQTKMAVPMVRSCSLWRRIPP